MSADADDDNVIACAITGRADIIVSADKHLLKVKQYRAIPIIHPNDFLYMLDAAA